MHVRARLAPLLLLLAGPLGWGAGQGGTCNVSIDAGASRGGSTASGTSSGGSTTTISSSTTVDDDVDNPNCGCRTPGPPPRRHAWLAALPALLALRRRRRRQ